jgi:hypothetical protein
MDASPIFKATGQPHQRGLWSGLCTQHTEDAVQRQWKRNGRAMHQRRAGGMKPETPAGNIRDELQ